MRITVRELKEYILALKIVKEQKPLLAMSGYNKMYPEIGQLEALLENTLDSLPAQTRRGQTKVDIEIPKDLQTEPANKAIRYGIPQVVASARSARRQEITLLDSCYGIAVANRLLPAGQNDFRLLTTKEEEELI